MPLCLLLPHSCMVVFTPQKEGARPVRIIQNKPSAIKAAHHNLKDAYLVADDDFYYGR